MALPGAGEFTALYTDMVVREDLMQLFGFLTLVEKEWHRLLLSVQGVGAKASLAILGTLGPDGVSKAIALGDWTSVKAAKGIGPKTAQRVVNELKDKTPKVMAMAGSAPAAMEQPTDADTVLEPVAAAKSDAASAAIAGNPAAQAEALSALTNLGYGPGEAASAVAQAMADGSDGETAALIRAALKLLAPKG
jgi:Holliday junction DNA helicase RuvA